MTMILFFVFDFIFDFLPFIIVNAVRRRKNLLRDMLLTDVTRFS